MHTLVTKKFRKPFFGLLLFVFIFSLVIPQQIFADSPNQQTARNYTACIIGDPKTATEDTRFPDIKFDMRVINDLNVPISNVLNTDLQIQENSSTPVFSTSVIGGQAAGADFYFVFDAGNRTSPLVVKRVLNDFYNFMQDKIDSVTLISNKGNDFSYLAKNISSKDKFREIIDSIPDKKDPAFYTMYRSIEQLLKDVAPNRTSCDKSLFVVIIAGDTTFEGSNIMGFDYSDYLVNIDNGKLLFIHNGVTNNEVYKTFTESAQGTYIKVPSVDETADLTRLISSLEPYRKTYEVVYRTLDGGTGTHQLKLLYQGQELPIKGSSSYEITLEAPSLTLTPHDTILMRVAKKQTEAGYVFNTNNEIIDVKIDWKEYPREVTSARLIVDDGNPLDVQIEKVDSSLYRITWDFSEFDQKGEFQPNIKVQLFDELSEGIEGRVITGETSVKIINDVPVVVTTNTWLLYGLYILFGAMVITFLIWRKKITASIVKGGKSVGEAIRKTIVGNRNSRKNPIAVLVIIDGPTNMIGKELPIYAESVNLGRDPSKSDLTFYGPESATSVSGQHCKLQRVGAGWQITALSSSHSETFVEEQPLPFLSPVVLGDGQKVRMGYLAQQPVEFVFHVKESESAFVTDPRKTNALKADARMPSFVPNPDFISNFQTPPAVKQDGGIQPPSFPPTQESDHKDGSIFDEFR